MQARARGDGEFARVTREHAYVERRPDHVLGCVAQHDGELVLGGFGGCARGDVAAVLSIRDRGLGAGTPELLTLKAHK